MSYPKNICISSIHWCITFLFLFILSGCEGPEGPQGPPGAEAGGWILLASCTPDANSTFFSISQNSWSGEESSSQFAATRNGVMENLFVVPSDTPASGSIVIVTLRINSTDTPLSLTYTNSDGTSVKSDISSKVNIKQGDLISIKFSETGGVYPNALYRVSLEFK